ncbi:hypothetical protein LCGC14_0244880 [marine sediment metagenome]|uniref:Uncharacterized protein n=1 Tax=marine sediment metagenome TaxID=412755 RepID=A0A0F9WRM3_9ZZZZ
MPASKRMVRGGGDLPRNPARLKKKSADAAGAPQESAQLELVPEPQSASVPGSAPAQTICRVVGLVITIKSSTLRESEGKSRDGKPPVYRSVIGKDAGGKSYWMALEMKEANPQKGEQWVVQGRERKAFGKEKDPLHPIDVTSFKPFEEDSSECAKVSSTSADTLVQTMAGLVREHGNYTVLKALAEAIK